MATNSKKQTNKSVPKQNINSQQKLKRHDHQWISDDQLSANSRSSIHAISSVYDQISLFVLMTHNKSQFTKTKELLDFVKEKKKQFLDEMSQLAEEILLDKEDLYSSVENRAHDTKIDEVKSLLAEKQDMIYKLVDSFRQEIGRISNIYIDSRSISHLEHAYKREFRRASAKLPFYGFRAQIIENLRDNNVLIIIGETGSGKTTQVPQYLLEAGLAGPYHKIVCTQPRKIAAISVAKRIAEELNASDSSLIYCKTGMHNRHMNNIAYEETKLILMTDQHLLAEYKKDPMLHNYSIVIIDEAHERTLYTDLLLCQLKDLVERRKLSANPLKVIIMSATINEDKFSIYFDNCPVIRVPGRTYPVKIVYEKMRPDYLKQCIDKVKEIVENQRDLQNKYQQDILAFLPGIDDINKASSQMQAFLDQRNLSSHFLVMSLHGRLEAEDQAKIFQVYADKIKIIFSTNVAETSLTINGVSVIVDSGRVKERMYDQARNISVMKLKLISKSSAIQRKGRAGRCSSGICYRLYDEQDYEQMELIVQPEIHRIHLGIVVLQLVSSGIKDVLSCDLIDKPDKDCVTKSMRALEELRFLSNGNITESGLIAAAIYLEPSIARIIIEGLELGVPIEMIKIAAMMTVSNCLFDKALSKNETSLSKLESSMKEGDFVSFLNIYNSFDEIRDYKSKRAFCRENKYSFKSLNLATQSYSDLFNLVKSHLTHTKHRYLERFYAAASRNYSIDYDSILKCICAGLHTNLAYYNGKVNGVNVYKIFSLGQEAFIHFESVLAVMGEHEFDNQFLLFSDLARVENRLFMRNITPVKLDMLKPYTDTDFSGVKMDVKQPIKRQVNVKVIGIFREKNGELIEAIEEKIGSALTIRHDFIETQVAEANFAKTSEILDDYIKLAKKRIESELFEYKPTEQTNVRVLLKSSLQIHCILLDDEYLKINFYDIPASTTEHELSDLFSKHGTLLDLYYIKVCFFNLDKYSFGLFG